MLGHLTNWYVAHGSSYLATQCLNSVTSICLIWIQPDGTLFSCRDAVEEKRYFDLMSADQALFELDTVRMDRTNGRVPTRAIEPNKDGWCTDLESGEGVEEEILNGKGWVNRRTGPRWTHDWSVRWNGDGCPAAHRTGRKSFHFSFPI